jgi:transcriptional regulator with XRE-family HTH domain
MQPQSIAERSRALRGNLGLSQRDLARRAGVTQPTVARWEDGQLDADYRRVLARIQTLAAALGVNAIDLLEGWQ